MQLFKGRSTNIY